MACGLMLLAFSAHADDAQNLMAATKQAMSQSLKDPAAQFKNLTVVVDGKSRAVCGEVKWKNSDGSESGFTEFYKSEDASSAVMKKGDVIIDPLVDLVCER